MANSALPLDTSHASQEAKEHFLKNIKQMGNNAVLLRRTKGSRMEPVFISDEFAAMMECSIDEAHELMSGMGYYKSTNPEDRPLVRSMMSHRVAYDGSSVLTIQKITAKKNRIWCNVHYAFIDDFGEEYLYCTYTDVTALKQHEERLRSVYSNMGASFYRVNDKTLVIFRANLTKDAYEEIRGTDAYDSDSLAFSYTDSLHQRVAHLPISVERSQFLNLFGRDALLKGYAEGTVNVSQTFYTVRKSGRACFVRISASLTRHPLTGDVIAFVTEQECNDEKVKDTLTGKILAERFDMVAYLSNGRYDVSIGEAAKVKAGGIFPTTNSGLYEDYLNGRVYPALVGSDAEKREVMRALSLQTVAERLKVAESYAVDICIQIDDEVYYKQFDFYAIDLEAEFYIVLKTDSTEIQKEHLTRNEELKMALDAANQANVAKTAFLSSMSHEIRTPMNAIIGLDSIALKDPDLPDSVRDHLEKIGASARHLLTLINDILDMSRIESGRLTIRNEEFSFVEMLEQINTMINSQCVDRGLDYRCNIKGHIDDFYIGDNVKLKQVIINILGNAVKFTPEGGSVDFSVERIAEFEGQSTLRFTMADTGVGMDASYLPKIFDAFSQEEASKANKYGSTGLGMAITKNIVELMNGNISVESQKGVGTTFTVDVTLRNSNRKEQRAGNVSTQGMKVLVVDDDPIACEHARIVLEEIGIAADTYVGGAAAIDAIQLKAARHEAYDLVLVDWQMPEMDGLEVTRRIREICGNDSAVIVLTAYNWDEIADDAVEAGIDDFMAKPLFASSVVSALQKVASNKGESKEERGEVDLSGCNILLAEDIEINAEIMKELLDMIDITADWAENGQVAVDKFAQSEPGAYDAVLMDVQMPVMNGLEATRAIRALDRPDAKSIPIIAMTANAFDEDVQRSLQAGMSAHLTKPVDLDRLFETLGELLRR